MSHDNKTYDQVQQAQIRRFTQVLRQNGVTSDAAMESISRPEMVRPCLTVMLGRPVGEGEAKTWERRARRLVRQAKDDVETIRLVLKTPGGVDVCKTRGENERTVMDASAGPLMRFEVEARCIILPVYLRNVPVGEADRILTAYRDRYCPGWPTMGSAREWVHHPTANPLEIQEQALGCLQEGLLLVARCVLSGEPQQRAYKLTKAVFAVRLDLRDRVEPDSARVYLERLAGIDTPPRPDGIPLH